MLLLKQQPVINMRNDNLFLRNSYLITRSDVKLKIDFFK